MEHPPSVKEKKLQTTLDSIQKRFSCPEKELTAWRNSLFFRYSAVAEELVRIEITDFDDDDNVISLPNWISYPIPTGLCKSVIRIYVEDSKRITLSLYFRKEGTGTLLCQGNDCRQWDNKECKLLRDLVSDFCLNESIDSLQSQLIAHPIFFLEDVYHSIQLSSPVRLTSTARILLTPTSSLLGSISDNTETEVKETVSVVHSDGIPKENTVSSSKETLHSTPTKDEGDSSIGLASNLHHAMSGTIKSHKPKHSKRSRRRTMCPKRLFDNSMNQKLQVLEDSQELITVQLGDLENRLTSQLYDVQVSIKNEIKQHLNRKIESMELKLENLNKYISQLETQINITNKENNSLKTQMGTLQSKLKLLTNKAPVMTSSTQCDMQRTTADEQVLEAARAPDPSLCPELQEDNIYTVTVSANNSVKIGTQEQFTATEDIPKTPETHLCITSPVSTQNRFDPLTNNESNTPTHDTSGFNVDLANSQTHNASEQKLLSEKIPGKKTPEQILQELKIPDNSSSVLVGDSGIRHVDTRRLGSQQNRVFKLCIPGVTLQNLTRWMTTLPAKYTHIHTLIIHVGVNDCPAGPVSIKQWMELMTLCKKSFPAANIAFIYIIPARGQHPLINVILPTNKNLQTACDTAEIYLINNQDTFLTPNGAPRQALYKDFIHPSMKGVARLAVNFKQFLPRPAHSSQYSEEDDLPGGVLMPKQPAEHLNATNNTRQGRTMPYNGPRPSCGNDTQAPGVPPVSSMTHYPMLPSQRRGQQIIRQPLQPDGPAPAHWVSSEPVADSRSQTFQPSSYIQPHNGENATVHQSSDVSIPFPSRPYPYPLQTQWNSAPPLPYPPYQYPIPPSLSRL